jgi:hypothetical protein
VDHADENDTGQERDWNYGECADDYLGDNGNAIIDVYERLSAIKSAPPRLFGIRHH